MSFKTLKYTTYRLHDLKRSCVAANNHHFQHVSLLSRSMTPWNLADLIPFHRPPFLRLLTPLLRPPDTILRSLVCLATQIAPKPPHNHRTAAPAVYGAFCALFVHNLSHYTHSSLLTAPVPAPVACSFFALSTPTTNVFLRTTHLYKRYSHFAPLALPFRCVLLLNWGSHSRHIHRAPSQTLTVEYLPSMPNTY